MPRNLSNESAGASSNAANNGPEGDVLLAGGVSAGSPQTFTGHNQFTEPVQVNTLNSALDIVVGRYLYTNNDIGTRNSSGSYLKDSQANIPSVLQENNSRFKLTVSASSAALQLRPSVPRCSLWMNFLSGSSTDRWIFLCNVT